MASGDRNYDIATETTQQELLAAMGQKNRFLKFLYNNDVEGTSELLSVTGRGRLYNCYIKDHLENNKNIKLQIEVDDELLVDVELKHTSSSSAAFYSVILGSIEWVKYGDNNTLLTISPESKGLMTGDTKFVGLSNESQSFSANGATNVWVLTDGYISFNESLKVTATASSGTNGVCSIIYSLD